MTREQRLASTFVELADSLVEDFDVVDILVLLTERSVELLGAAAAGLLLVDANGDLRLMAATNEALHTVELFQIQNDEGPCRDCIHAGAPVEVADLTEAADRWPRFAPVASAAGFRAAHAFPLRLRGRVLGAMNLFRVEPLPMTPGEASTAQALADVATIAVLQSRALHESHLLADQLQGALHSRIAIEQAKGVIAERLGCDMDTAFRELRDHARRGGRRLADVAADVVAGILRPEDLRPAA